MSRIPIERRPDLRNVELQDIVKVVRDIPWSTWLFETLDAVYKDRFLKAKTAFDYANLRDHVSFMLTYFIPMHLVEVSARHRHEARWAAIAELADAKHKTFESPASGTSEYAVLKLLASRESTEFNLIEPLNEQERAVLPEMIDKGYIERVGMDRPHPLKPHDYTLVLTDVGRAALTVS